MHAMQPALVMLLCFHLPSCQAGGESNIQTHVFCAHNGYRTFKKSAGRVPVCYFKVAFKAAYPLTPLQNVTVWD
jgi:hypothetical protein